MNIFPLTGYMDCYLPQVCILKTFSRHFTRSRTDLYEARAILLGRLGRHDQALETYVYRLQDYTKAEEYVHSLIYSSSILTLTRHCKRVYRAGTETSDIFLALLKLYLRPTSQTSSNSNLLQPALELISRHGPRLDAVETLQLLPPLVTADDIRPFLIDSLRTPVFDTRVVREISKARNDQLARRLMALQSRRVKVTDSRMLVLNHSAIELIIYFYLFSVVLNAINDWEIVLSLCMLLGMFLPWFVHLGFSDGQISGEVTHYQCREPFSRHLRGIRG